MERALWIAEKDSLAQAVASVLGDDVHKTRTHTRVGNHVFVPLFGHALQQAMPDHYLPDDVPRRPNGEKVWRRSDLPIFPSEWTMIPSDEKKDRIEAIREFLVTCDVVYHLGDPDEEGQRIVDEVLEYLGNTKPVRRVLVNDYNPTKVREAIAGARSNDDVRFRSWSAWGLARSRFDWLLGMNGTRALTLRGSELGYRGLLPVGSVKTPLLYVIRERDRAIETFKPVAFYTLAATFKHPNGQFVAKWQPSEDLISRDDDGRILDRNEVEAVGRKIAGASGQITDYAREKKNQKPPLPASMNELQRECFARWKYTAVQVMEAAQRLYEIHKVATYPRSEVRYLSEAHHSEAPRVLAAVAKLRPDLAAVVAGLDVSRKSAAFNDKKMSAEGEASHHAIIPTTAERPVDPSSWSECERNVYDVIVRAYLVQFAPPYEYWQTNIEVCVAGERFKAGGKTPVALGWRGIFIDSESSEADAKSKNDDRQTLPIVAQADAVQCAEHAIHDGKTTPPKRFDDGSLWVAMEKFYLYVTDPVLRDRMKQAEGLGTTATRPEIIKELKDTEMLVPAENEGQWKTSPAARTLIDALPIDVKAPEQAGRLKLALDSVGSGATDLDQFMAASQRWIAAIVDRSATLQMKLPQAGGVVCPKCKEGRLRQKEAKEGHSAYWFCSRWNAEPKCDARFQDVLGKPLLQAITCPTCKQGTLRRQANEKGAFWFCSRWNDTPKCAAKFDDKAGRPDTTPKPVYGCPKCRKGQLHRIKSNNTAPGKGGWFWGCSEYRAGCKATYPDLNNKPNLSPSARR